MLETSKSFWENTYKQNINKMIGVAYRYTDDRQIAEDLAHDAFIIAYEKVSSYEGKGPFEAWLRKIMVNVCLQYLREQNKKKYWNDYLHNETDIVETYDENSNNKDFTEDELLEAINQLPEHHKLVFNMYVIDKFTHAQIGKELGISEGTSKSHLARARHKIKELLHEQLNSEKKQKKKIAALFLFWNIDGLYRKRFKNFGLPNHQEFSVDSFNPTKVSIPNPKPYFSIFGKFSGNGLAFLLTSIAFLSFLFWQKTSHKDDFLQKTALPKKYSQKTATISKTPINSSENKNLTKNIDSMKNLKTIGAILVTGANLAMPVKGQNQVKVESNINTKVETKPTVSLNIQAENKPNVSLNTQIGTNVNLNVNPKPKINTDLNIDLSGTFYGEKLYWSAEDNELYFQGKAIINFGENNNIINGTANFLGKVYYLVYEGKPMSLNAKIKLSEKKYNLIRLSPKTAIEKYGDFGKKGAIEISLVE